MAENVNEAGNEGEQNNDGKEALPALVDPTED